MAVPKAECFHIKLRHSDQVRKPPGVSARVQVNHTLDPARIWRRDVRNQCKLADDKHTSVSGERQSANGAGNELYSPAQATTIRESWDILMRWSRVRTRRAYRRSNGILQETTKVRLPPHTIFFASG